MEAFEEIADKGFPLYREATTPVQISRNWICGMMPGGINPKGKGWYFEAGAKMGDTLMLSDQKKAYTLTDMGTFLNYEKKIDLKILFKGDPVLRNNYSTIAVNPDKFPAAKYREAMDFIAFVTSPEGQSFIADYKKHGVNLFYPDAVPSVMEREKTKSRLIKRRT